MNIKAAYYLAISSASIGSGILAQLFGAWDTALQVLCIVMGADYLTGLLCALVWKKSPKSADGAFESHASIKGLFRKAGILLVVLIGYQLDKLAGTEFIRVTVITFFIANDGFSVVENLGIMGLPMPKVIKNAFEALRDKADKTE